MERYLKSLLLGLTAVIAVPAITNAQLIINGELRPRAEYRHGYKSPSTEKMNAAAFVSQRTRLNLNFTNEKMKFKLSLQDVRVWGDVSQQNLSDNSFSVHEAWGEYFFTPSLSFKAGRTELIYDDARLFGNVDWAQQGRSHDIGLLKFENTKWKAHAAFAFNQDKELLSGRVYTIEGNYKTLQLLWANRKWEKFDISVILVNNGMQTIEETGVTSYKTKFSQTFGGSVTYKLKPVTFTANIYKQAGTNQALKKVNAYMFSANANFGLTRNFNLVPGFEYISGTSQVKLSDNETNSFIPLYGTAHKFNGHMDYFFVGNHLNSVGLQDVFAKLLYSKNNFNAGIDFHLFAAAADIADPLDQTATISGNLGQEIDFYAGYKFSSDVILNAGISHYFTKESLHVIKGGDNNESNDWIWVSISFKPEFLNIAR